MKTLKKVIKIVIISVLSIWITLTIWVEIPKGDMHIELGKEDAPHKALIIYNPDPFYNLDEQVCIAFGATLADNGIAVTIATVKMANRLDLKLYDLYVCCANTYNAQPDWPTNSYIKNCQLISGKKVVAITLGAGTTDAAQEKLEQTIKNSNGELLSSYHLWLLKPNDESRTEEENVAVAIDLVKIWAEDAATKIKKTVYRY